MAVLIASLWHKLAKNEKGQFLLGALIVMLVGAVIVTATLAYAYTAIKYGQRAEAQVKRFYAADAGVEYGLWYIIQQDPTLTGSEDGYTYTFPEELNNCEVDVRLKWDIVSENYTINGTATDGDGFQTIFSKYYVKI